MASTNRNTSAPNIIEHKSFDCTYLIRAAQKCLTFTSHMTKMKHLQLHKLSELSDRLDVKLYLIKTLLPEANDILNNESSQYAKDKLLEIVASICHVDEAIEMIGKDEELVNYIFYCFSICYKTFRLQKTLFKFLALIGCEIQSNSESKWIYHLTRSHYVVGFHILRIITQYTREIINNRLLVDTLLTEMMIFLEPLSELTMPDSTNGLEHLFKINDLVSALVMWYSAVSVRCNLHVNGVINHYFVTVVLDKWLKIVSAITKLHSFRHNSCDIDRTYILSAVSSIHHSFRTILYHCDMFESPVCTEVALSLFTAPSIGAMYRSVKLLNSLSGYELLPRSIESIIDISNKINILFELETLGSSETVEVRRSLETLFRTLQYLHIVVRTRDWSSKDILELVLLWHATYTYYASDKHMLNIIVRCNLPHDVRQQLINLTIIDIALWYLLHEN